MGRISNSKFLKRTENKRTEKRCKGPQIDLGFMKFQDQMETSGSQE
jgi:hypothetical protein